MVTQFFKSVLANSSPYVLDVSGASIPFTITLKSTAIGRGVEMSTDNGIEFFSSVASTSTTTMQVFVVTYPISNIRVTGAAGNTISILH